MKSTRIMEYQETIIKLVEDTISELGDSFMLTEKEFQDIIDLVEEPHTFSRVWKKLSQENQQLVDDIEIALKKETIGMDIIDQQ